jgi:site-specific DNA recombinase
MKKIVAIYSRVSTDDQAQHGVSLDAQIQRCSEYASSLDGEVELFVDAGISAKTTDRPALQRLLALVNRKQVSDIICLKLDRLSRNTVDALNMVSLFAKKNCKLHLVAESGEVQNKNGDDEFLLTLRASLAQLERRKISERTRFALNRKRELGQRISGKAPYGYSFTADGKLEVNALEQRTISKVWELKTQGLSIRSIQAYLTGHNYLNREGKTFGLAAIFKMLKAA